MTDSTYGGYAYGEDTLGGGGAEYVVRLTTDTTPSALDLQEEALARLRNNPIVVAALTGEAIDPDPETTLEDSDADILPAALATESDADPRVTVAEVTDSTSHDARLDTKIVRLRTTIDASHAHIERETLLELKRAREAIKAELTADSPAWSGEGISIDEPIRSDETLNRYLGVVETTHERTDVHPQHRD